MPGFKTIGYVVPALLAVAGTYATPFQKRDLDDLITHCNHDFAYTFDGGPSPWNTDFVKKFDSVGGKTTFFVNGKAKGSDSSCIYSEENVKALRYGYEHDHQYASYTWSHSDLATLTEAQIDEEILRLDEAFVKILGVKPKFLRPPFGSMNDQTASYIQAKHDKTIVIWNLDPGDPQPDSGMSDYVNFFKTLTSDPSKADDMSYITHANELNPLMRNTTVVDILRGAGVTLQTVAGCLDLQAYEFIGGYGERDATWTCDSTLIPSAPTIPASKPARIVPSPHPVPSASSSAPPTKVTHSSVPDGPNEPDCETQDYQSLEGETCSSIETKFALQEGSVSAANTFVDCDDIWANTDLSICVPAISDSDSSCTSRERVKGRTTCAAVGKANGVSAAWIKAWNPWLDCTDIWGGTDLCVAH